MSADLEYFARARRTFPVSADLEHFAQTVLAESDAWMAEVFEPGFTPDDNVAAWVTEDIADALAGGHADDVLAVPLLSDDELAMLSDDLDAWPDEHHDQLVYPFADGLGFDWPDTDGVPF